MGFSALILFLILGIYVGVYLCLIGGIIQIIQGIKDDVNAYSIAFGICRIVFAGISGWIVFIFGAIISQIIFGKE